MTNYIVTKFDGDPDDGTSLVLTEAQVQEEVKNFLAHPGVRNGMGIQIRKAGYLGGTPRKRAVKQSVQAGGDVYQAGRDLTVVRTTTGVQYGDGNHQINHF